MPSRRTSRKRPCALGEGPIANSASGGHIETATGLELPRWVVMLEYPLPEEAVFGIIVDTQNASIARWMIVPKGDPVIQACSAGFGLGDKHLVVPSGYYMKTGRQLGWEDCVDFIAPILDFIENELIASPNE